MRRRILIERGTAWLFAIGLHLLLLLAFVIVGNGTLLRGAQARLGEGEAVEVTLSGWEGASARSRRGQEQSETAEVRLDRLMERLRETNSPLFTTQKQSPPAGSLADLFDGPAAAKGKGQEGSGNGAAGRRNDGGQRAETALSSRVGEATSGDSSAGSLWRQIEPCWKRLPLQSVVPVTLEVSLRGDGRLAKPPRILRPSLGRPEEGRLVAEARALQAISACLPYAGGEGLGQTHQIVFPGARAR